MNHNLDVIAAILVSLAVFVPLAVWFDKRASKRIERAYTEAGVTFLPVQKSRSAASNVVRIEAWRGNVRTLHNNGGKAS